jgi:putative transposase
MRAGIVAQCEEWPWSSARRHLGVTDSRDWLAIEEWSQNWTPALWRVALQEGLSEADLRARLHEATRTGRPFGEDQFVEQCEQQSGLTLRRQKPGPKSKSVASYMKEAVKPGYYETAVTINQDLFEDESSWEYVDLFSNG